MKYFIYILAIVGLLFAGASIGAYASPHNPENYKCIYHQGIAYEQGTYEGPLKQGKYNDGIGVYKDNYDQRSNSHRNLYPGDSTNYMVVVGIEGGGCVGAIKYEYGPQTDGGMFVVDTKHGSTVKEDNHGRDMYNEDYENKYTHLEAYWIDTLLRYRTNVIETNENYIGKPNGPAAFVDYNFTFNGNQQKDPDPTAKYMDENPARSQKLVKACNDFIRDRMLESHECVYGTINVHHRYYEGKTCDSTAVEASDCKIGRGNIIYEFQYTRDAYRHVSCGPPSGGTCHDYYTITYKKHPNISSGINVRDPNLNVYTKTVPVIDIDGFVYNNMDGTYYPGDVIAMKYQISFPFMTRQHILFNVDELYDEVNLEKIAGKQCFNRLCKLVIESTEPVTSHLSNQTFTLRYGEGISLYNVKATHDAGISPFRHPVGVFNTLPESTVREPNSFAYSKSSGVRDKSSDFIIPQWYKITSSGGYIVGIDNQSGYNVLDYSISRGKLKVIDRYELVNENGERYTPTGVTYYFGNYIALLGTDKNKIHMYHVFGERGKYVYTVNVDIPGLDIGGMNTLGKWVFLLDKNNLRISVNDPIGYLFGERYGFNLTPENSHPIGTYYDYNRNIIGVLDAHDKKIYVYKAGNPTGSTFGEYLPNSDIKLDIKNANPTAILTHGSKIYVVNGAGSNAERFVGGLIHDTSRHPDRPVHTDLDVVYSDPYYTWIPYTLYTDDEQYPFDNRLAVGIHYHGSINSHPLYSVKYYTDKHSVLITPLDTISTRGDFSNITKAVEEHPEGKEAYQFIQKSNSDFDGLDPLGVYKFDSIEDRQAYYNPGDEQPWENYAPEKPTDLISSNGIYDFGKIEQWLKEIREANKKHVLNSMIYEDRRAKIENIWHASYGLEIDYDKLNKLSENITMWDDGGAYISATNNDTNSDYYGTPWEERILTLKEAYKEDLENMINTTLERCTEIKKTIVGDDRTEEQARCEPAVDYDSAFDVLNATYYENPETGIFRISHFEDIAEDLRKNLKAYDEAKVKKTIVESKLISTLPHLEAYYKDELKATRDVIHYGYGNCITGEHGCLGSEETYQTLLGDLEMGVIKYTLDNTGRITNTTGNDTSVIGQAVDETEEIIWGGGVNPLEDQSFSNNGAMGIFFNEGYGAITFNHHIGDYFYNITEIEERNAVTGENQTYTIETTNYKAPSSYYIINQRHTTQESKDRIIGLYDHPVAEQFIPVNVTSIDSEGVVKPITISFSIVAAKQITEPYRGELTSPVAQPFNAIVDGEGEIVAQRFSDDEEKTDNYDKVVEDRLGELEANLVTDAKNKTDCENEMSEACDKDLFADLMSKITSRIEKQRTELTTYNDILDKYDKSEFERHSDPDFVIFEEEFNENTRTDIEIVKIEDYEFNRAFFETQDRGLAAMVADGRNAEETHVVTHNGTIDEKARILTIPEGDLIEDLHDDVFNLNEKGDPALGDVAAALGQLDGGEVCGGDVDPYSTDNFIDRLGDSRVGEPSVANLLGGAPLNPGANFKLDIPLENLKPICAIQSHIDPRFANDAISHPMLLSITISNHTDIENITELEAELIMNQTTIEYIQNSTGTFLRFEHFLPSLVGDSLNYTINTDQDNIVNATRFGDHLDIPYNEKFGKIIAINDTAVECYGTCRLKIYNEGNLTALNEWGGKGHIHVEELPEILIKSEKIELPISPEFSMFLLVSVGIPMGIAYFYVKMKK